MSELNRALTDILEIRARIAAGTAFRGFGPIAMSVTALVGAATAVIAGLYGPQAGPEQFVEIWMAAALLCAAVVGVEMHGRSRRHHSSLATAMITQAIEQFLPAAAACIFLPFFVLRFAPFAAWMVPGFWQIFVSLGIFASVRSLPRGMMLAGGWYFLSGFACLVIASTSHVLTNWMMGVPFFTGQMLIAAILFHSARGEDGEA